MEKTGSVLETINKEDLEEIKERIEKIPDFPKKGVLFYDVFSILKDTQLHQKTFEISLKYIKNFIISKNIEINSIIGLESRGFLIGLVIADRLKLPFIPVRKKNKLPGATYKINYSTEYSHDQMEIQANVVNENSKVLIVDDLLATGGSLRAAEDLVCMSKGQTVAYFVLFEIDCLKGREKLKNSDNLISLINI